MQILKFKTIFIIFVSILLFTNIIQTYAQDYVVSGSKCAEITQPQTIPHNGIIKALIVYIKYQDDNFNLPPWTDEWPSNMGDNRPEWTNYMLSPEPDQLDFEPSITGYFKSMSLGQCKIIGDEYPINNKVYLANQISTYRSWLPYPCAEGPQAISLAVKEALTIYDDQIDYRQYDNDGPDGVPNSGDDDGYVDLIIAWFRFHNAGTTDCNGYNGVASLTGLNQNWFQRNPFIYDISTQDIGYNGQPIKINQNSGLIAEGTSRNNINIMVHEIGHKMGWGHYWHVGLWNMMGAKQGVGIMNTFERNVLGGWITPGKITIINSPVIHTNFNLKDFETTGEAIRLITNNGGDYILENRSGLRFYSRKGGWLMPNNGLLITRNGWETIECANHRWDWIKNSGGNCGSWCNNTYTFHTENNQFFRLNPTNTGLSTIELSGVCTDNNGCFSHPEGGGAAGNVYIQEYNEFFSTWSNPSSIGGITNNQDIVIEYLSRNADSSMNLYIHYDLPNGFQNTSPSKPL